MRYVRSLLIPALLVLGTLLGGCTSLNVHHLSPRMVRSQTPSQLTLKFWTLDYSCVRDGNRFEITGTALPRTNRFPAWSAWMSEMILTAYVCDPQGRVIVRKAFRQESGPFPPTHGMPFRFTLNTPKHVSEPAITFGYRMVILAEAPSAGSKNPLHATNAQVFFASQEALRQ